MEVITFYQFRELHNLPTIQEDLLQLCHRWQIRGTIILAKEGINGTIAGSPESIQAFLANPHFPHLTYKSSTVEEYPFRKLKIKIKPEIITIGRPSLDALHKVGQHIPPAEWNQLLQDPDLTLIDTRNDYEVAIGSFTGAINPQIASFQEFPQFVEQHLNPNTHTKIAMFCTGGIRCEKASALMLEMGFSNVYQLQGGILQYLADIPPDQSLWQGECFVFDDRTSLDHHLHEGKYRVVKGKLYPRNIPEI
jgi:UPF0176 protein